MTVVVPSYTQDHVTYRVSDDSCSCPSYRYTGRCEKHVNLAKTGAPLEGATRGILADGKPVIVLASVTHVYDSRIRREWSFQIGIWGFAWGAWTHYLCFDGRNFIVESTRHLTGTSFTWPVSDWKTWQRTLPVQADERAA